MAPHKCDRQFALLLMRRILNNLCKIAMSDHV